MSEIYCRSAPEVNEQEPRMPIGPLDPKHNKHDHKNTGNLRTRAESDNDLKTNSYPSRCASKNLESLRPHCRHLNNLLNQSEIEDLSSNNKDNRNSNNKSLRVPNVNLINNQQQKGQLKKRHVQSNNKCSLRAPIGPLGSQCKCSPHYLLNNILNQSEYELADDASKVDDRKNFNEELFEFADDAISLNNEGTTQEERPINRPSLNSASNKPLKNNDPSFINVNGKEELPSLEEIQDCTPNKNLPLISPEKTEAPNSNNKLILDVNNVEIKINAPPSDFDGNCNKVRVEPPLGHFSTLPKRKRSSVNHKMWYRPVLEPPHRVTPDGTDIYYWCDIPKRSEQGLVVFLCVFGVVVLRLLIGGCLCGCRAGRWGV